MIALHMKSINYDSKKHNNNNRVYFPAHQAGNIFSVSDSPPSDLYHRPTNINTFQLFSW